MADQLLGTEVTAGRAVVPHTMLSEFRGRTCPRREPAGGLPEPGGTGVLEAKLP